MNYLAHLFLSPPSPALLRGALAGDLVSGRRLDALSPEVRQGILLHRSIDAFADSHPCFARSRRRLLPFRHYARVIVDVFYDHLLAVHFETFSAQPLEAFAAETYELLQRPAAATPAGLDAMIDTMASHDWLTGYREVESIRRALRYLSRRFRRPVRLEESVESLERQRDGFTSDFLVFFPAVIAHAKDEARRLTEKI